MNIPDLTRATRFVVAPGFYIPRFWRCLVVGPAFKSAIEIR